ncbi:hypothetical protein B0H13DRAFT_94305 [Mycena leptocephala]|nr:hypothetical protein B0H13DRAFT_94305 [Mycena leptocephala]
MDFHYAPRDQPGESTATAGSELNRHRSLSELPLELWSCIAEHLESSSDILSICLVCFSFHRAAFNFLFQHLDLTSSRRVTQCCRILGKPDGPASRVLSLKLDLMDENYGSDAFVFLANLKEALSQIVNVRKLAIVAPSFAPAYLPDCTLPRLVDFSANFVSLRHVDFLERHRRQITTLALQVQLPEFRTASDLKAITSLPNFPHLRTVECSLVLVDRIATNTSIDRMTIYWNERSVDSKAVFRRISGTNIVSLKIQLSLATWPQSFFLHMAEAIPALWSLSISFGPGLVGPYVSLLDPLRKSLSDFTSLEFLCIAGDASGDQTPTQFTSEKLDEEFRRDVQKWVELCPTLLTVQILSSMVWKRVSTRTDVWLPTTPRWKTHMVQEEVDRHGLGDSCEVQL